MAQLNAMFSRLAKLGVGLVAAGSILPMVLYNGVRSDVVGEGTHFIIPWVQKPIIFDIRSRPRNVPVITGSKG
ncbi:hypothetical protein PHET_11559 [Paragonimus heterotremus]|uniref:Prohibitin n=1 Tax=Paragonimus heterotremus TaxID=100268 RepID=A0A8J4SRN0_9TREM|nr:hypothetical protein PHET_11559 [Paragonimus heterotremus]